VQPAPSLISPEPQTVPTTSGHSESEVCDADHVRRFRGSQRQQRRPHEPATRLGDDRRLHLIGIGSSKTGTVSLAAIFEQEYRTAHEADVGELEDLLRAEQRGEMTSDAVAAALEVRDARLRLEVDSNQLNQPFTPHLVRLFPRARFVFTVREPRSWIDSFYSHRIDDTPAGDWKRVLERELDGLPYPPEEEELRQLGLPPIATRLEKWRRSFELASAVPDDRLLVLRTHEISRSLDHLAEFAGVDVATLAAEQSHSNRAGQKHHVLDRVDPSHVDRLIEAHCEPWLGRWFPDAG